MVIYTWLRDVESSRGSVAALPFEFACTRTVHVYVRMHVVDPPDPENKIQI